MESNFFIFFLAILAGFALIILSGFAAGTPLASLFTVLSPILAIIGLLVVLLFALALIWKAINLLFNR
ncbi:hypothetical protein ELQ35_15455 [Peribacillus cavernae]|uniref:Uncharacterized protein n=1 Tax=Peribacillus cavernae TaxID=1674310 RepID=A0A433HGR4_9BACI|nr:hypothetical protein [Peribacillus cavernae]MDQ0220420.1 uncharacterized membrane protein YhaH (DUF805 family) [Peribacillus cavernae]RUQ27561.1 hypothetical protein ELQ35_15455 [Peribacillus cavernae]